MSSIPGAVARRNDQPVEFYGARSIAVENANDAGEVACNKPEAQARGFE